MLSLKWASASASATAATDLYVSPYATCACEGVPENEVVLLLVCESASELGTCALVAARVLVLELSSPSTRTVFAPEKQMKAVGKVDNARRD